MRILFFISLLLVGLLIFPPFPPFSPLSPSALAAADCELTVPCPVGDRSFHARPPDNWDGKTLLPVLLYFHGWGRQGPLIMKHSRIAGATCKLGVLLPAPNGLDRT